SEVQKILETAERNAKRGPVGVALPQTAGAPGGGPVAAAPAGGTGAGPAPAGAPGAPPAAGGVTSSQTRAGAPQDRLRFQQELQKALGGKKLENATPEEQQKAMAQARRAMQAPAAGGMARTGAAAGPGGNPLDFMRMSAAAVGQFSEQDRANAKLPLPPEEDSQLQVLLRPGLLADIEITVERIPNALHVPVQAVFDRNGQSTVYVQHGSRFEERPVQVARRSESTMVLSGGVQPGEVVALGDPNAKKTKSGERKGGKGMGSMPGGASK
ncbi:MAG TPA: hypothetical protein VG672_01825, partial [Bryobacteraceae bacterium]|nr:hypothetical protein [Bryobacteraceae bacterium]